MNYEPDHSVFNEEAPKRIFISPDAELVEGEKFYQETDNLRAFFKTYEYDEMRMIHLDGLLEDVKKGTKNYILTIPVSLFKFGKKGSRDNWLPMIYIAMSMIRTQFGNKICSIEDIVDFIGYSRRTDNYQKVKKGIYEIYERGLIKVAIDDEYVDLNDYNLTRTRRFRMIPKPHYTGKKITVTTRRIEYLIRNSENTNIFILMNSYLMLYYWGKTTSDKRTIVATDKFFKEELGVKANKSKLIILKRLVEIDLLYVITQGNIVQFGKILSCPYFISTATIKGFVEHTLTLRDFYLMRLEESGCKIYTPDIDTHCLKKDVDYRKKIASVKMKLRHCLAKDENGGVDFEELTRQEKELEEWRVQYKNELSERKYLKENPVFGDPDKVEVKYNPTVLTREQFRQMKNDRVKYVTYKPNTNKQ